MYGASVLEAQFETVDSVLRTVALRATHFGEDPDEFRSWALYRLSLDGCQKLRAFRGEGSFRAYVRSVAMHLMRDFRISCLGKWRPCSYARTHGEVGVYLDRAIVRDRPPVPSPVEAAVTRFGVSLRDAHVIAAGLPQRSRPREVGLDNVERVADHCTADRAVVQSESAVAFAQLRSALEQCLSTLDPEEQELLRLRFWAGMTVAHIARRKRLNQASLYRRIDRSVAKLRQRLLDSGCGTDTWLEFVESRW